MKDPKEKAKIVLPARHVKETVARTSDTPEMIKKMTACVLDRIYKHSLAEYNDTASKMERRGNSVHIEANLEFQKRLQANVSSELNSPAFKKDIKSYVRHHSKVLESNAFRRGLTRCSFLDEQDDDILENMSAKEITNALGTKPKIDFKE